MYMPCHTKVCIQDTDTAAGEDDERNIAELLVDQIEFADVILLNKLDLVPDSTERQAILAVISSLNPAAKVHFTTNCKVCSVFLCIKSGTCTVQLLSYTHVAVDVHTSGTCEQRRHIV